MLTPTQFFGADLFSRLCRKKWSTRSRLMFDLGAVLPDLPMILAGFYELLKYCALHPRVLSFHLIGHRAFYLLVKNEHPPLFNALSTGIGYHQVAWFVTQALHTYFFWIMFYLFCRMLLPEFKNLALLVAGAVFFHVTVDMFTHSSAIYAYFWPLVTRRIPGFVSPATPWFLKLEFAICAIWIFTELVTAYRHFKRRNTGT